MGALFTSPKKQLLNIINNDIVKDGNIYLNHSDIKNNNLSSKSLIIIVKSNNKNQSFRMWFQINGYSSFLYILDKYYINYTEDRKK